MEDFRLKVFRVVAERCSFTQAAEILHVTQPAITLQIKNLETSLNVRLFDRTGGKVQLTPAGSVLLGYARQIEDLYEQARRAIGGVVRESRGTLHLGASTTIAQYLLPRILSSFLAERPSVRFSITSGNTEHIVNALLEGRIELGMIEGPSGHADIKAVSFTNDEIVLIAPAAHEWAGQSAPFTLKHLAETPLILREHGSGTRQVVETALRKSGLSPKKLNIVMSLDSTEAIKSAVEAGLGFGFVSQWAVIHEKESVRLAVLPIQNMTIHRKLSFIYPHGPEPTGLPGEFLQFALERFLTLKHR